MLMNNYRNATTVLQHEHKQLGSTESCTTSQVEQHKLGHEHSNSTQQQQHIAAAHNSIRPTIASSSAATSRAEAAARHSLSMRRSSRGYNEKQEEAQLKERRRKAHTRASRHGSWPWRPRRHTPGARQCQARPSQAKP
jgi:hypothetical protein